MSFIRNPAALLCLGTPCYIIKQGTEGRYNI